MAARTVVAGSLGITARQMKDFWRQVDDGSLGHYHMQDFLNHRNPFEWERNDHGHIIVTITGLDLTGAQEIERLEPAGYGLSSWAKLCLLSAKPDSYDANHRLVAGQEYKIALVPGKEIEKDAHRKTQALCDVGIGRYGYDKPLAGIIPRIRNRISDKQMEEMGFWYIAGLHEPIEDSGGGPRVLYASRGGGGRWVHAFMGRPGDQWNDVGAFAFLVPASAPLAPAP